MSLKEIDELLYDLENELIEQMFVNIKKYCKNEDLTTLNRTNWRLNSLVGLEEFKKQSPYILNRYRDEINKKLSELLKDDYVNHLTHEEKKVLSHIINGNNTKSKKFIKLLKSAGGTTQQEQAKNILEGNFFKVDNKKIKKLIYIYEKDLNNKAFKNILSYCNNEYKNIILKSELGLNMGLTTTHQAIDYASNEFLARGINNVVYKNGAHMNVKSYCEMVIRTNQKELQRQADADFRKEIGENLVQMTSIGACCSKCAEYQGRIMIDDVYNDGKGKEYTYLSEAFSNGCFHPNCRHDIITYYSFTEQPPTRNIKQVEDTYEKEQEQRYNERKIREWKRKKEYYLNEQDRIKAEEKLKYWQARQRKLIDDNSEILRRNYWREKI